MRVVDWNIDMGKGFIRPYFGFRKPDSEASVYSIYTQLLGLCIYLAWEATE